ncbi:MAG: hypothetical protein Ct9H300mP17_05790 [Candidatus Nitrosopelagicus sp.]|nr:MAG: hypothetical protein Ct9H300mP17_05790 [Candidatus Nitrosopelagicus sp.]
MLEELVGSSTAIERAINGEELTFDDGMEIQKDDNLHVVGAAADIAQKKTGWRYRIICSLLLHELH